MREDFCRRDDKDPLVRFRDEFVLPPGIIYLDGNSLGPPTKASLERLREVAQDQWGGALISSWNVHDWIGLPRRVGSKIARLVGAHEGEVLVTDSTTVNIFRLAAAALAHRPERPVVLVEQDNFPADNYVIDGIREHWHRAVEVRSVEGDALADAIDSSVGLVVASHVNYRSGRMLDMQRLTAAAREHGAWTLWDLSHSTGAVSVDLARCGVDLAVGCTYKYLNGGPGAPAFLYVARRHQSALRSPIQGWLGHAEPFAFSPRYTPAPGIGRHQGGTPPILSLAALDAAIDVACAADPNQVRAKSVALTTAFIELVQARCPELSVATPTEPKRRGSQVALRHREGYPIVRALIDCGVVGDFRAPDILRFGFAPLYNRFAEVFDAVGHLERVMRSRAWDRPEYRCRTTVT